METMVGKSKVITQVATSIPEILVERNQVAYHANKSINKFDQSPGNYLNMNTAFKINIEMLNNGALILSHH